jgi:hypothetical protein
VLEEGSYVEDDVMLEYLAGMLAAARTADGRDDRAAYYANTVASMTANRIRLHHAVYATLATAPLEEGEEFGDGNVMRKHTVYTSMDAAVELLDAPPGEDWVSDAILSLSR